MLFLCSMKTKLSLLLIIALFGSLLGFAGEPSKTPIARTIMVSGKVMDVKSNELLAGVKIECSNCEKSVYSDLDGKFLLVLQVTGSENLKIEFSQVGYSPKILDIKEVQVNSGNLYIDLQPE